MVETQLLYCLKWKYKGILFMSHCDHWGFDVYFYSLTLLDSWACRACTTRLLACCLLTNGCLWILWSLINCNRIIVFDLNTERVLAYTLIYIMLPKRIHIYLYIYIYILKWQDSLSQFICLNNTFESTCSFLLHVCKSEWMSEWGCYVMLCSDLAGNVLLCLFEEVPKAIWPDGADGNGHISREFSL